jgi:hypothetical protein
VAEIEAARRRAAENPPPPPDNPRDLLHLSAIRTWQALAGGRPAPDIDLADLEQAIYEGFVTSDSWHPVDQLCERWLDLASQCGLAVDDEQGDLPPDRHARHHFPHHLSRDLVRPDHRIPDPDRQVYDPRKFLTHCHAALPAVGTVRSSGVSLDNESMY